MSKHTSRKAEAPGRAALCYTADGRTLVVAGPDRLVKAFDPARIADNAHAPLFSAERSPGAGFAAVACAGNMVVTGSADRALAQYELHRGGAPTLVRTLHRFLMPVRAVALNSGATIAAAATEESTIRLEPLAAGSKSVLLSGHSRPVLSVDFDPLDEFLISTAEDGCAKIWRVKDMDQTPECVKTLDDLVFAKSASDKEYSHARWSPSGKYVAIPCRHSDIVIVERDSWKTVVNFSKVLKQGICTIAWSPNGLYVAVATVETADSKPELVVLHVMKKNVALRFTLTSPLCSMAWNPLHNQLTGIDFDGNLKHYEQFIPLTSMLEQPTEDVEIDLKHHEKKTKVKKFSKNPEKRRLHQLFGKDSDDDDDEGDDVRMDSEGDAKEYSKNDMDEYDSDDDFVVDDDGSGYAKDPKSMVNELRRIDEGKVAVELSDSDDSAAKPARISTLRVKQVDWQDSFQNGATKARGDKRYLTYNLLGFILSTDHTTHCAVKIEFHDREIMRPLTFSDYYSFSMGCLEKHGAFFAREVDHEHASVISYKPFDAWASDSEWNKTLPGHESVVSIGMNDKSLVVATDQKCLRFFSLAGVQTYIFTWDGSLVSLPGARESMCVVSHAGGVFRGEQNLAFSLIKTSPFKIVHEGRLPIGSDAKLVWIGFSEEGKLYSFDSHGVLRVLLEHTNYRWMPVWDERDVQKGDIKQRYWAVGVREEKFMCLVLKNHEAQPGFPAPMLTDVDLTVPTLEEGPSSARLEAKLVASRVKLNEAKSKAKSKEHDPREIQKAQLAFDRTSLQLIQEACKKPQQALALDYARDLHMHASIDGAAKLARAFHATDLSRRIERFKAERVAREGEEEESEDDSGSEGDDEAAAEAARRSRHHHQVKGKRSGSKLPVAVAAPRKPEPSPVVVLDDMDADEEEARENPTSTGAKAFDIFAEDRPDGDVKEGSSAPAPAKRASVNPFAKKKTDEQAVIDPFSPGKGGADGRAAPLKSVAPTSAILNALESLSPEKPRNKRKSVADEPAAAGKKTKNATLTSMFAAASAKKSDDAADANDDGGENGGDAVVAAE